jgi:hypothetical protein
MLTVWLLYTHSQVTLASIIQGSKAALGATPELKVAVTVSRSAAFWAALPQLQQQGVMPCAATLPAQQQPESCHNSEPQLAKLFPRFVDDGLLQAGADRQQQLVTAVEAGEGHGPRKEFFAAAAANCAAASGPDEVRVGLVLLACVACWSVLPVHTRSPPLGCCALPVRVCVRSLPCSCT